MARFPHRLAPRFTASLGSLALLFGGGALATLGVTAAGVAAAPPAAALQNTLARTPQMGFNNWNSTHCRAEFNEDMVKGIADLFVSKGLKDAGYTYVNLDDCWALPQRDASGNLVPDPVRFPHGIKAVADYVHSKGLKFGLYSSAGTKTCDTKGFPGGLGHEQQDANLWASWGVDYLKYDNCNNQDVDAQQRYRAMGDALKNTGRDILYSICEWGSSQPQTWARDVGNSWRTTGDISDSWNSMLGIAHANQALAPYAQPGAWNDPDMLEVGNGGMTDTEYRTHFSLWAEMASPLLIGSDLRTATPATMEILTNKDVIAVDQDPLGRQGTVISSAGGLVVMSKPLADGSRAITLTNETDTAQTIATTAQTAGIGGARSYTLKDLWTHRSTTVRDGAVSAQVPPHGTAMFRLTPSEATDLPAGAYQLSDLAWSKAQNATGPVERDHSNGGGASGDGRTLSLNGTTYPKGLGTSTGSDLTYYLGRTCKNLTVSVGVDDETAVGDDSAATFRIYRDSTVVADSGPRTAGQGPLKLSADLTGGENLRLTATSPGSAHHVHADWADARLACGDGPKAGEHALSDLAWSSSTNAWGPVEKDTSNGEYAAGDGHPISIGGTAYTKGLGVHAPSTVTYYLGGTCTSLTTDVGVDDEVGRHGTVDFTVLADGVAVAHSGTAIGGDAPVHLTAPLTGAHELTLQVTDAGDGNTYDHADWANPVLTCA
ncbi:NPCBM/NEW2 domain-containing protein [Kitasatospora cineracea]|uniref:Alpha-galactosidase n=1 Tax=Kitasatospora cineracea TaxID=88074 RepID=A0A8G1ULW8_9ACTN|nr:NPCBM/NEW2 domain-containing protein [Kitasatospora cineracea]ROR46407.1 alpha-galactosidase [Kitasatospora cineracea]